MESNIMPFLFGILAIAFFVVFFYLLCTEIRHKKVDKVQKSMARFSRQRKGGPEDFAKAVQTAYDEEGSILGMLEKLQEQYTDGKTAKKLNDAKNYLQNSRYKDYETTLYYYLSDGSDELKELFARIILKEIGKRMRLPMKE